MNKKSVFTVIAILVILSVGLIGCNAYKEIYGQSEYWVGTYAFEADVEFLSSNHKVIDKENTITIYVELREDGTYRLLEKVQDVDLLITLVDYVGTWELTKESSGGFFGLFEDVRYCIYLNTERDYDRNKIYILEDGVLTFNGDQDFHEEKCGIEWISIGGAIWR